MEGTVFHWPVLNPWCLPPAGGQEWGLWQTGEPENKDVQGGYYKPLKEDAAQLIQGCGSPFTSTDTPGTGKVTSWLSVILGLQSHLG